MRATSVAFGSRHLRDSVSLWLACPISNHGDTESQRRLMPFYDSRFRLFKYFPKTPFHGGITIETAP